MSERESERVVIDLYIKVTLRGKTYNALIINVSKRGMCILALTSEAITDFIPGEILDINIITQYGDKIIQQYEIRWLKIYTQPIVGLLYNLGARIVAPFPAHNELYKCLEEPSV
jgi:hypothetical protein